MMSRGAFQVTPCTAEYSSVSDVTVAGPVPPGLTSPGSAGNRTLFFDGTPRQPGDWHVVVTMHKLECSVVAGVVGPVDYGDITIPVDFHIDP